MRFNPMQFAIFARETSMTLEKVPLDERTSRTRFEISFKCDGRVFVRKSNIGQERPRSELRCMWRATLHYVV